MSTRGARSLLGTGLGAHTLWEGDCAKLTLTLLCKHIQSIDLGMGTDLSDVLRRFVLDCVDVWVLLKMHGDCAC